MIRILNMYVLASIIILTLVALPVAAAQDAASKGEAKEAERGDSEKGAKDQAALANQKPVASKPNAPKIVDSEKDATAKQPVPSAPAPNKSEAVKPNEKQSKTPATTPVTSDANTKVNAAKQDAKEKQSQIQKPKPNVPADEKTKGDSKTTVPAATNDGTKAKDTAAKDETKKIIPAPIAKPTNIKAADTKSAKSTEANIRFQFDGISYADVIDRFAKMTKKPLLGDAKSVEGTLTFFDSVPYTYNEALDTLNLILAMRGHMLVESGRFLRIVPVSDLGQLPLRILSGLDEAKDARQGEVVTVVLPVLHIDVETASKAVVPMVSVFGRIAPLARGNGLLVTDTIANLKRIRILIALMDQKADAETKLEMKSFLFKHGSATSAATIINNLLRYGTNLSSSSSSSSRDPRSRSSSSSSSSSRKSLIVATADANTNVLILRGTKDMMPLAEQIVEMLDSPDAKTGSDVKVFGLKTASSGDVADAIRVIYGSYSKSSSSSSSRGGSSSTGGVQVYGDSTMNSVFVRAPIDKMTAIEKMIKELDQNVKTINTIRAFPLEHTSSDAISDVLAKVLAPPMRGNQTMRARVTVTSDDENNVIYVSGPDGMVEMAAKMIADIDKGVQDENRQIHIVSVKGSDAASLAQSLVQLYEQQYGKNARSTVKPVIQGITASNSLLISSTDKQWEQLKPLVEQLDKATQGVVRATTRVVAMKHARAEEMAETLWHIFETGGSEIDKIKAKTAAYTSYQKARSGQTQASVVTTAKQSDIIITPSKRNNSLVIVAMETDQERIAQVIESLDIEAADSADPIRVIQLKSADAAKLAVTLTQLIPTPADKKQVVFVQADPATNSVLIRAPESERKLLEEIIASLDEQTKENARELRILALKHVSASSLAPMLTQLYAAAPKTSLTKTSDDQEKVIIAAAPGDRTLVVDAPKQRIDEIAKLVESMDTEDGPANQQIRTYPLVKSNARELASSLSRLFAPEPSASGSKYSPTSKVAPRFDADTASNQLMVSATTAQFEAIEKVIKDVEQQMVQAIQTRTFRLKHARAEDVAPVIETMLADAPLTKKRSSSSSLSGSSSSSRTSTVSKVRVAALIATNDVIVQGPMDRIALAEVLIKTFDDPDATQDAVIQIVHLKNAQSVSLAEAVSAVISAKVQRTSSTSTSKTSKTSSPVSISAEPNSNSVLVRGQAKEVKEVVDMIQRLDSESTGGDSKMKIFRLENGNAGELQKTFETLFKSIIDQQTASKKGTTPPPFSVGADERTNSLLVSTTPVYFVLVEELLNQLDKAEDRPQRNAQYFWLENADVFDVALQLDLMFEDREGDDKPVIQADVISNALTVVGKDADLKTIEEVVAKIDKAAEDNSVQVRVVPLKGFKAKKMADMLKNVYEQTSNSKVLVTDKLPKSAKPQPEPESDTKTDTPQPNKPEKAGDGKQTSHSNASVQMHELAMDVVDGTSGEVDLGVTQFIAAEVETAAPKVTTVELPEPEDGKVPDVVIAVDEATNSLIISGTRQQLDDIELLISQFSGDVTDDDGLEFRVYPIQHSDPQTIANLLTSLFNPKALQQQNSRNQGNASNQIQQQIFQMQQQMLQQVQGRSQGASNTNGGGKNVLQRGNRNSNEGNSRSRGNQNPNEPKVPSVAIVADQRTSRVIVRGKPVDLDLIGEVIKQLDTSTTMASEVRIFSLENTNASEVASNLSQMFMGTSNSSRGGSGGATNTSRAVLIRKRIESKVQEQTGSKEPVDMSTILSIGSNQLTNSILVAAPAAAMDIIAQVIQDIDQAAANASIPSVRMYPLKHADLLTTVNNLRSIYAPLMQGVGNGGSQGKVVITADASANTIIVSASPDQQDMISQVITDIDKAQPGEKLVIKVYRIDHAEASSVAQTLSQTLIPGGQSTRLNSNTLQWLRGPRSNNASGSATNTVGPPLRISADTSSNAMVVRATEEEHKEIARLIKEIDVAVAIALPINLIPLKHADAQNVSTVLNKVFVDSGNSQLRQANRLFRGNNQAKSLVIEGDRDSKMLMVRADDLTFAKIKSMAEQLDVASPTGQLTQKLIQLKHADAGSVASTLTSAFSVTGGGIGSRVGAAVGQTSRQPDPSERVSVVAETVSNAVIVTANEANHEKVESLIAKIDTETQAGLVNEFLVLENVTAAQLAPALASITSGSATSALTRGARGGGNRNGSNRQQVIVSADPGSNALILSGPAKEVEKIKRMASQLDVAKTDFSTMPEIVPIKNGDAVQMAGTIRDLFTQTLLSGGSTSPGGTTFAVSADERANALIIVADQKTRVQLKFMIQHLETISPEQGQMRIISIKHADPNEVQNAIYSLYGLTAPTRQGSSNQNNGNFNNGGQGNNNRGNTGTNRTGGQPNTNNRSNQGRPNQGNNRGNQGNNQGSNRGGQRGPRSDANPIGGTASTTRTTEGGRVSATPLPNQRALIVNANDEDFAAILKLVQQMDQAAEGQKRITKVVILEHATNQQIAASLTQLYSSAARSGVPEDRVFVTALPGTDAVVIAAVKEKVPEVEALIAQLDQKEVSPQMGFKIFTLENASPTKILPILQQMMAKIEEVRQDKSIAVQADERTKSIIVTARGTAFDQIGKIIEVLDRAPAHGTSDIIIVQLKRADATRLAAVLTEMLKPNAQGQVTEEARALQEQVRKLKITAGDGKTTIELDLTKPIRITSDPIQTNNQGSNTLLLSSTPENLKSLEALVKMMDQVPLTEAVKVQLVHLKVADAEAVAQTLIDIFTQGQKLAGKPGTSVEGKAEPDTPTGKALVNPLNVSADTRTNTIVMSGLPETLELAAEVVKDLDRESSGFVTEVRLFQLKHASADALAPMLAEVFAETEQGVEGADGIRTQVTRLRTVIDPKAPKKNESDKPKARAALTIRSDEATQTLVVAARSDIMPLIADVIKSLDIPGAGAGNIVRIMPLENADATRIKTVIDSLYTGDNAKNLRAVDIPTVAVDSRTNAVVISTSEKSFIVISAMMKQLDKKQPIEFRELRLVKMKNAEAASLAPILQKAMDERVQYQQSLGAKDADALRVLVTADARSNSLIVGGSNEGFKLVESLAKELDNAGPALATQIQVFPLKEANAGTMSITLQQLFDQRYAAAATPDVQRQKPTFLPDLRINALLVAANPDDTKVMQGLLKKMDVKLVDPSVGLHVIAMKHNDAGVVGPAIQRLFLARLQANTVAGTQPSPQEQVNIETDSLSNAIIVSASKENMGLIQELLKKVDVEPPAESGIVRMYPLINADATRVSAMLQNLIQQGLYKPGTVANTQQNQAVAAREKIAVEVDTRTNVVIVSASKENFSVIEEIIKKVDAKDSFGLLSDLRLYELKNADATRLAPTLQQFFDSKLQAEKDTGTGSAAASLRVSITPDARTNTLLVTGSKESFAAVEEMIKRLDGQHVAAASQFRVFELKQATATAMQPTLQELFTGRVVRGDTKDTVTVLADSRSNSLIIGASAGDMTLAEGLIKQLDVKRKDDEELVSVFPLGKADASQVAEMLRGIFDSSRANTGNGGNQNAAAGGLAINVDERLNAIVVSGGKADIARVEKLVKQFENHKVAKVTEIRVFTLQHAQAAELATILTETLNSKPELNGNTTGTGAAGSSARQTLLQFISQSDTGKEYIAQALQEGVVVTPDPRTNSLIVSAPLEYMALMNRLVKSLDQVAPRDAEIHVHRLKNADATQMAQVLSQMFKMEAATTEGERAVRYTLVARQLVDAKGNPIPNASATVGTAEQYALTITVDTRTNALLVGGSTAQVDLVGQVVEELDSSPAQERKTDIFRLRHGQAADIETALRSFLDQERQRLEQALGQDNLGAAQKLLEREVALVAEPATNSILVSASPRYYPVIKGMIDRLDDPKPQVLVQVLLAEVVLTDDFNLGFEWQYSTSHNRNAISGGTDFGVDNAIDSFGGLGVSVTGGNLTMFLQALQAQRKVNILSRPQILCSDNQPANINIGQRVPFVTNSRLTDNGDTVNTIQYQDIGILLNVVARISDDGFVRMDVNPEISSIDEDNTVQISEGLNATIFNNRSAETTVTVQDGQTIVIGGLITSTESELESKVPVLGDIPLIGPVFRSTSTKKDRRELLIILTPRIITSPEDVKKLTEENTQRIKMMRDLDVKDVGKAVDIPFNGVGPLLEFENQQSRSNTKTNAQQSNAGKTSRKNYSVAPRNVVTQTQPIPQSTPQRTQYAQPVLQNKAEKTIDFGPPLPAKLSERKPHIVELEVGKQAPPSQPVRKRPFIEVIE